MPDSTGPDTGSTRKPRRGRPRARLISCPPAWRAAGRSKLQRAMERFNGTPDHRADRNTTAPRQPAGWWDEGLIHAYRAELLPHQSATAILKALPRFEAWLREEERRPDASADREQAMKLFIAEAAARAIIRKRDDDERAPMTGEIADVFEFLFEERIRDETLRKRLQRFYPRLKAFRKAESRRKAQERAARRASGEADAGSPAASD